MPTSSPYQIALSGIAPFARLVDLSDLLRRIDAHHKTHALAA